MDDTEKIKIQIKGTAYTFRPFTQDELSLVLELRYMGASDDRWMRVAMQLLREAGEKEQWEALSDRLVDRDIRLDDVSTAFTKLFERQLKRIAKDAANAQGDDE